MSYLPEQERKADRIARFLCAHPDKGITRERLATRLRARGDHYNSGIITALWPLIERSIDRQSDGLLFALRPVAQYRYRCAATTSPLGAELVARQRDKYIVTRMINDLERGTNQRRLEHDPRFGSDAIRRSIRMETYLLQSREAARLCTIDEEVLLAEILAMEEIA